MANAMNPGLRTSAPIKNPNQMMNDSNLPSSLKLVEKVTVEDTSRFSRESSLNPSKVFEILTSDAGNLFGYIVVDDTRRGPGLGGIRIASDIHLNEVKRLARAMTLKNAAACLPYGGGKAGVLFDSDLLNQNPPMKEKLIGKLADALFDAREYISAPDMGTNEKDIQQIHDRFSQFLKDPNHTRGGAGRPPSKGGIPIDDWALTAHSLFASIKTLEEMTDNLNLANCKVVIQGFGNVGSMIAEKLSKEGALIVGASDINAALWNPKGMNLYELKEIRNNPGGLNNYCSPVERKFSGTKLDWLLEAPCDILIPAARPDALTARNADRLQCKHVFQGANAPCNKMTEYYLWNRRKIINYSDFIVNVGGVMGCAVELKMNSDPAYRKKVLSEGAEGRTYMESLIYNTVAENFREILSAMEEENGDKIFREYAEDLAFKRLNEPEMVRL